MGHVVFPLELRWLVGVEKELGREKCCLTVGSTHTLTLLGLSHWMWRQLRQPQINVFLQLLYTVLYWQEKC